MPSDHSDKKAEKPSASMVSWVGEIVISKEVAQLILRWSYAVLWVLPPDHPEWEPEDPRDIEHALIRLSEKNKDMSDIVERLRQISMRIANLVVATHTRKHR